MSDLADAVEALDGVLAARPAGDPQAFSQALRAVCRYRDALRRARREGGKDDGSLAEANGAVTLLMTGRYPLGEIPWPALERLRARLDALARQAA